ncbi:MAG: hypothetical protein JO174_08670 [Herbaspirillum sp.]|nr:hypothetical protein [Herbaspirillum sp.]
MLSWLSLIVLSLLATAAADRAWLRHVARDDLPLHDPEGYLEMTARMTELCHGDRARVDALVAQQRQRLPQGGHASQAELVRRAMQDLLAPQATGPQ